MGKGHHRCHQGQQSCARPALYLRTSSKTRMQITRLPDKLLAPYIPEPEVAAAIDRVAEAINAE